MSGRAIGRGLAMTWRCKLAHGGSAHFGGPSTISTDRCDVRKAQGTNPLLHGRKYGCQQCPAARAYSINQSRTSLSPIEAVSLVNRIDCRSICSTVEEPAWLWGAPTTSFAAPLTRAGGKFLVRGDTMQHQRLSCAFKWLCDTHLGS
jgi:hypothetical protein